MTTRCYILVSSVKHLRKQINNLECVTDMVQTQDGMFVENSNTGRQATIAALMNTRVTRENV